MINQMPDGPLSQQGDVPPLKPGDWILIKAIRRKLRSSLRWDGPFQVRLTTPTAVRIAERPPWIHLTRRQKQVTADQRLSRLGGGV